VEIEKLNCSKAKHEYKWATKGKCSRTDGTIAKAIFTPHTHTQTHTKRKRIAVSLICARGPLPLQE
jgi:hypothetical protein